MLVLSRRSDEKILLPDVGISVTVLGVRGNAVKIGVQAPQDVRIVRGEIQARASSPQPLRHSTHVLSREEFHALKNRLNAISLAVRLFHRQREIGNEEQAEATLQQLLEQLDAIDARLTSSEPVTNSRTGCRALLVEDDANERELLAGLLRMNGYSVVTAGDGYEALEYLRHNTRPDVVLLDMRMPRCDGPTTIKAIRAEPEFAALRILAVSATEPAEFGVPTGRGGVDGWFAKPLNPEVLTREIDQLAKTVATA